MRFPDIDLDKLTPAQAAVVDNLAASGRGAPRGPFLPLLQSPALCDRVQALGAHVRFGSPLPPALRELAILVVARRWTAQFEFFAHSKEAAKVGVADSVIEAIRLGQRPDFAVPAEAAVHDFVQALVTDGRVSDGAFAAVVEALGYEGAIELVGLAGHYSTISFVLNVAEVPLPGGAPGPMPPR
jgi:4-carboxymuconolactone decarboxylase